MLGKILQRTLFMHILFLFMAFFWHATIIDASPILANKDDLIKFNDDDNEDASYFSAANLKGALIVKRSLHSTIDQPSLIDNSRLRSRARHRRLRKKLSSSKLKTLPNIFQSTGTYKNHHRTPERINPILDDRLKRFRMLDPDEFQEMLNSWSHQMPDQTIKELDSMDTIGGMQLENYWARK